MWRIPRFFTEAFGRYRDWLSWRQGADGYSWIPLITLERSFEELSEREWRRKMVENDPALHPEVAAECARLKALMERLMTRSGPSLRDLKSVDRTVIPGLPEIDELEFLNLIDAPYVFYFTASREHSMLVGISVHRIGEAIPPEYLEEVMRKLEELWDEEDHGSAAE